MSTANKMLGMLFRLATLSTPVLKTNWRFEMDLDEIEIAWTLACLDCDCYRL